MTGFMTGATMKSELTIKHKQLLKKMIATPAIATQTKNNTDKYRHKMEIKVDENIELYPLKKSDAKDIFHTINSQRAYLGKWLPFVELTKKIEDTEKFVDSVINEPEKSSQLVFTIRIKNEFIGIIGLKDIDKLNKKAEIGYWISERHQKFGIITKSVNKLCDVAFNTLDINRIQIKCAPNNNRSKNIPKRLGFKYEGTERDGELLTGNIFTDLEIHSKLKHDV